MRFRKARIALRWIQSFVLLLCLLPRVCRYGADCTKSMSTSSVAHPPMTFDFNDAYADQYAFVMEVDRLDVEYVKVSCQSTLHV
jgi:hypothetical protein